MCTENSFYFVILLRVLVSSRLGITETVWSSNSSVLTLERSLPSWDDEWKRSKEGQGHQHVTDWPMISEITGHVWVTQNDLYNKSSLFQNDTIIFIFDKTASKIVGVLTDIISSYRTRTGFLLYNIEDISDNFTVRDSLNILGNLSQINSVFLLTGNEFSSSVLDLLNYVSSNAIFKWTSLIHTAEWMIVTTSPNRLDTLASVKNPTVDFITLVTVRPGESLTIAQKSRKQNLTMVSRWNWFGHCSVTAGCVCATRDTFIESIKRRIGLLYMRGKLRANAGKYLQSQKSVLDGLHVPVSLFNLQDKLVYTKTIDNKSNKELDGYCIAMLKLFASSMGFTFEYLMVTDGGFYGDVEESRITGITGHLARREAAFSPLPLSMMNSRTSYIDFIPVPMKTAVTSFMYKLPPNDVDTTYAYIFKYNFLLLCLGPALVACFVGALLHVSTNSCTQSAPQRLAFRNLRRLGTFPDHVCLQAAPPASQSSRVLTASWSVMCFVCVSAYSAYLTSTFTVTSPELTIKTFKDLIQATDYEFGIQTSLTAIKALLSTSGHLTHRKQAWNQMVTKNKTDPRVISNDTVYHYKRVQAGRYVYIAPGSFVSNESLLPWDIRMYAVEDLPSIHWDYICLPTNAFYKDEFYNLSLSIQTSKIIDYLLSKYNIPAKNNNSKLTNESTPIQVSRFELTIYVVLCGVGISVVCLLAEFVYYKCRSMFCDTCGVP